MPHAKVVVDPAVHAELKHQQLTMKWAEGYLEVQRGTAACQTDEDRAIFIYAIVADGQTKLDLQKVKFNEHAFNAFQKDQLTATEYVEFVGEKEASTMTNREIGWDVQYGYSDDPDFWSPMVWFEHRSEAEQFAREQRQDLREGSSRKWRVVAYPKPTPESDRWF